MKLDTTYFLFIQYLICIYICGLILGCLISLVWFYLSVFLAALNPEVRDYGQNLHDLNAQ